MLQYIRENLRYLFVRDNIRGGLLRYVYEESGKYVLYCDDMFKGIIKKYITDFDESIIRMSDVEEIFRQLNTDLISIDTTTLNADEEIINFSNGILDLKNMYLLPHNPDYRSTIQIPCEWTENPVPTPVFDKFMSDLTEGRKDIEKLLLQFMGVCLSNIKGWRLKKALFLVGKGDTGKSQLKSLTEKLLGKGNYIGIELSQLEARFGTSNIYMKRLAGSADMSYATIDELKILKQTTGGDSIYAEFKGKDGFEFIYDGLLWFCMNKLPKFGGDNGTWVYDRIIVVECNNIIPLERQDKQLQEKLYAERGGIIYKAVMATRNVIANGYCFDEPQSIIVARNDYRATNNTVITFFAECMEERQNGIIRNTCTTGKVYAVYKAWCSDNNHGCAKTFNEFKDELMEHLKIINYKDMTVRRGTHGTFFRNFTITAETKQQYSKIYGYIET